MLRKDVKYMLAKDWEPSVPSSAVIHKQSEKFSGRLSGSVRLVEKLTVGSEYKNKKAIAVK